MPLSTPIRPSATPRLFRIFGFAAITLSLCSACTQQTTHDEGNESTQKTAHNSAHSQQASSEDTWPNFQYAAAEQFIRACQQDYAQTDAIFKRLDNHRVPPDKLLIELDDLDRIISGRLGFASLMANVHPHEEMRNAAERCDQNYTSLITQINLSKPLFTQLDALNRDGLAPEDIRYIESMLRDFRRGGVNLSKADQLRIEQLNDEINQLGQDFRKNIRNDVKTLTVDADIDLSGLPNDYVEARLNDEKTQLTITTNYPDYIPVMQYANNDKLRLDLYKIYRKRGYPANTEVLKSLLQKRFELATLLGYPSYAHYITEVQMIKTPEHAQTFIDKAADAASKRATLEYQQLLSKLKTIDPSATKVGDWQKTYLSESIKKSAFSLDSQEVRQYFQYNKVRQGIFDLTETLFDVEIRPWQTDTWHPSVESFEVVDNGKVIGQFYLDMHPRDGKYKHAAAFTIQDGIQGKQLPIKALVCNFPSGDALMEHSQVETYLHEFGHLLHGIFGGHQKWAAQSGIKTERDFVEAPSQMLEEWIWDSDTLRSFATNADGEAIPDRLINKLKSARDFGKGLWTRHQMFYAALSLNYYNKNPNSFELDTLAQQLQNSYSNFQYVDDTHFQLSFGHLYGYSAVYYTYMWSLVIADDMFSRFQQHGLLNKRIARDYRDKVLAPGGTKDAADLVEDFLGRPYTFDAFEQKLNQGL